MLPMMFDLTPIILHTVYRNINILYKDNDSNTFQTNVFIKVVCTVNNAE